MRSLIIVWLSWNVALAQNSLIIGSRPATPGATVSVPFLLTDPSNAVALQFDFQFDSSKVTNALPVANASLSNHILRTASYLDGSRRVVIYSPVNAALSSNTLMSVPVTLSPNERVSSSLNSPFNVIVGRINGTALAPVYVYPGTVFVRPVIPQTNGSAQCFLHVTPGLNYVLQASTNLVNWTPVSTNFANDIYVEMFDPDSALYPTRFYRALAVP